MTEKNTGWICSRCGGSNSPTMNVCGCSPKRVIRTKRKPKNTAAPKADRQKNKLSKK